MATYKTISSKEIIRKVMRDLDPPDADWIHVAIEWIGEALEHIGAGAHVETKGCVLDIDEFKGMLPADLYYINQVSINETEQESSLRTQIDALQKSIQEVATVTTFNKNYIANTIAQLSDGTITSNLTANNLDTLGQIEKFSNKALYKIIADASVIYTEYMNPRAGALSPIKYCTTNFPRGIHCEDCINESVQAGTDCYLIENDRIKTTFRKGKICLSYTAFATDTDCYPLIPDDISFKEAMFWYIFKKMLLRGMESANGFDYMSANQQWQYYCTQARNEAKYPDIDRYESFMNQWVRLIPNINRHDTVFEDLNTREDLYRGNHSTNI